MQIHIVSLYVTLFTECTNITPDLNHESHFDVGTYAGCNDLQTCEFDLS